LANGRSWFQRIAAWLIEALSGNAWKIIVFTVITGALAGYYSYQHLTMKTSRDELISTDQRLIRLSREVDRQFGSLDNLVVVVENTDLSRSIRFAEALAGELRQYPHNFRDIFYRVDPEKFKKWALLYVEQTDLAKFKESLWEHRRELEALAADPRLVQFFQVVNEEITRAMIGELFTGFLKPEEAEKKIPNLDLLQATLQQLELHLAGRDSYTSPLKSIFPGEVTDFGQEGYFLTENDKYLLFLVTAEHDGHTVMAQNVRLLREAMDRVKARVPGIEAGVTGPGALEADEMSSALADVELASLLALVSQMALLTIFFRSLTRTLVQGVVMLMCLVWTFGIATLVVGHLNILSIVFAPLLLGMAEDLGVYWYSRLEEEQGPRPRPSMENWVCTMKQATPGVFYAALTTVVAVAPLIFTGFKGLEELGIIVTLGNLLTIFLTLGFLPALAVVTERIKAAPVNEVCAPEPQPFLSLKWQHPFSLVLVGIIITVIGLVSLFYVRFDLNPLHLQNPRTESVVWELKLIRESKFSTSYGTLMVTDFEKLRSNSETLKKLETVSHVESILSFLPSQVEPKQALMEELQPVVGGVKFTAVPLVPIESGELASILGRLHFKLSRVEGTEWEPEEKPIQEQITEINRILLRLVSLLGKSDSQRQMQLASFEKTFMADLSDKWQLLQDNLKWAHDPPGIQDLPQEVRQRFVSPEGNYLIRVFPSGDVWHPEPLGRFVRDLKRVDQHVVGDPVLLYQFTHDFRNAVLWTAEIAILGITILIFFYLRSWKLTLLALIPLMVGTALTLILMWVLDVPFNQANVLFLPLILGEGVEYGIIILGRWQAEPSARAIILPAGTAKGILLAALTTTFAFGSLMVSGHQGTFSLGLLATIGSLSIPLAALSVLPALLRLLGEHGSRPRP
jgi:hypothetical protein